MHGVYVLVRSQRSVPRLTADWSAVLSWRDMGETKFFARGQFEVISFQ